MDEHQIERTALRMSQKYGKKALPKAVDVIKYYLAENDDENAKRWVTIGYAIKRLQQIETIKDALSMTEAELASKS